MAEKSSVFDMIGPIMIGPSSSHTAGVVRIARVARKILAEEVTEAKITFYNSFARTYQGHGSDRAAIAGLLDYKTDDKRIKESFRYAKEKELNYEFRPVGNASEFHPNTVKFEIKGKTRNVEIIGESRGGGVINIREIDEFHSNFSANLHTLIIKADDVKGSIAFIADVLSQDNCNIATMSVSRKAKADLACQIIEMDSGIKTVTLTYLESLDWVREIIYIPDIDM